MKELVRTLRPALTSLAVFTVLLGLVYPALSITLAARGFPDRVAELVGQPFDEPGYVWSRPTAVANYNAMTSSGTNLGPSNPALREAVIARIEALRAADPGNTARVPVDLVTASASGLDPDISPAAAYYQAGRVARARGVPEATIRALIDRSIEERTLGILERRVNVLRLNRAIDRALGAPR